MLLAKKVETEEDGKELLEEMINSGAAYEKFKELVMWQGGNINQIENPELLPKAKYIIEVKSEKDGYIKSLDAEEIGKCALKLGAGRETMDSTVDLSAGIVLNKKIDDNVKKGEALAQIHANDMNKVIEVEKDLRNLFIIGEKNKESKKLIYGYITKDSVNLY